jgi:hypothetical protein
MVRICGVIKAMISWIRGRGEIDAHLYRKVLGLPVRKEIVR